MSKKVTLLKDEDEELLAEMKDAEEKVSLRVGVSWGYESKQLDNWTNDANHVKCLREVEKAVWTNEVITLAMWNMKNMYFRRVNLLIT